MDKLSEKYNKTFVTDKHSGNFDTILRMFIGKTDDINVPLASHKAIVNRELGEGFCRVCHKDLRKVGIGRYNDYLILRHPRCTQPICFECSKNNPDDFHLAFRRGVESYKEFKRLHSTYSLL